MYSKCNSSAGSPGCIRAMLELILLSMQCSPEPVTRVCRAVGLSLCSMHMSSISMCGTFAVVLTIAQEVTRLYGQLDHQRLLTPAARCRPRSSCRRMAGPAPVLGWQMRRVQVLRLLRRQPPSSECPADSITLFERTSSVAQILQIHTPLDEGVRYTPRQCNTDVSIDQRCRWPLQYPYHCIAVAEHLQTEQKGSGPPELLRG